MSAPTGVALGSVDDLTPGEGRTYAVDGRMIAVFRLRDDTVRATAAVCPHRGGPLADGQIDAEKVMCPLHQYTFDFADGTCSGAGIDAVEVYRVEVVDGVITLFDRPVS